jgi:hypothetical protein
MAKSRDLRAAQDRILDMFNREIRNSNISEAKPLTLAEQLKVVHLPKPRVNLEVEFEHNYNNSLVIRIRNSK